MPDITMAISCTNGEQFSLILPEPAKLNSFYAFSMHKAGSSLMEKMLIDICSKLSIPAVNPHASAWLNGISTGVISPDLARALKPVGYAYLGFRHVFPLGMDVDLDTPKKILLVRDPRDMLTSLYFSHRHSHPTPRQQGSEKKDMADRRRNAEEQHINDFAIKYAAHYENLFTGYRDHLLSLPNTKVFRYENIIFDKENWLLSMLDFFGVLDSYPEKTVLKHARKIARKHDLRPRKENPGKHVRQVTPGNYKKHLSPDTIKSLDNSLAPFLDYFHYS